MRPVTFTQGNLQATTLAVSISDGATVSITNDDAASVTIADNNGAENGGAITVTATLDNAVQGGFTVDVTSVDGTATIADSDYTAIAGQTLTFAGTAGETQTFTLTPTSDSKLEANETVTFTQGNLQATTLAVSISDGATVTINNDDSATITIADRSGNEDDGAVTFTATLDYAVDGGLTVDVNTTDGTSTIVNSDYTAVTSHTLTFAGTQGETETFTVTPSVDAILETDETVGISMNNLVTALSGDLDITDLATLTIIDDDSSSVRINDVTETEGDNISFSLTLTDNVEGDVVVDVVFTNTTTETGDFTATTQRFTFTDGTVGTQTVTIPTNSDTFLENDETFEVSLSLVSGNTEIGVSDKGVGTIIDNDAASVTIDDVTNAEGDNIGFTLTLTNNVEGDVVVDISFANSTTEIDDFTTTSQQYTFTGGTAGSTTITVPTIEDTQVEYDEIFTANLTLGTGNINTEVDVSDSGEGTISNDDSAAITIADRSGNEDDGVVTFTAILDYAVDGGLTVDVNTTDGTATIVNSDYTAVTSQMLTFTGTQGETRTFTVLPSVDAILETDETVGISMNNLVTVLSGYLDITDLATVTINNDDASAVTIADNNGAENGGAITVTATLDNAVQGGFTVDVNTTDGTATITDSDYTAIAGQTLTFAGTAGETQTFTLTPTSDSKLEANETVTFTQSNLQATTHAVSISDGATVTINNDDSATITIADRSGNEDDGAVTFTATLDYAVDGGLTVDVNTTDGTSTIVNSDYTAVTSHTLTFAGTQGETETFTVTPSVDAILETDETVGISMNNLVTALSGDLDITDLATLTIIDDDSSSVRINDVTETEGDNISFSLTLTDNVEGDVVVDVVFTNTTTETGDFTATTQQFTFTGGTAGMQTVTVPTNSDTFLEEDETFAVSLSLDSGNSEVVTTDTGVGTIIDNDAANVTINNVASLEGDNIGFTLILDNDVEGDVVVDISFANSTTESGDFTATSQQYTFTDGTAGSTTITVPTTEDAEIEPDEIFTTNLTLGTGNVNGEVDVTDTGTGTINNDDSAIITIENESGNEDAGAVTFTATLDYAVEGGLTVDVNTADGTATIVNSDYTAVTSQTLTFTGTQGETQTFTVLPSVDAILETDETVGVSMNNLVATLSGDLDITDLATLTINNDDASAVTIADNSGVENGGAIIVTATLDNAVQGGFTVDVTSVDGTATIGDSDYTAIAGQTLTFAGTAGETQTFTLTPTVDSKLEANETVTFTQGNLQATTLAVSISDGATVSITNDDAATVTIADNSGAENGGAITVTATLDNAVQGGFTVDVTSVDGTATIADSDYTAIADQTLTFAGTAGETQTFTLIPTADSKLEANETVTFTQGNLDNTTVGVNISDGATVTINNDDASAVTIADNNGAENGGAITVTATLDNAVQGGFTVDVTSVDGTATITDSDYTAIAGQTLTFAGTAGETQTFTLTPTSDSKLEANETVTFTQSNLQATTHAVSISDGATVTINNDDSATITIADRSGNEDDGAVTFTATLDYAVDGGLTVDVNTTDGTSTIVNSDYTAVTSHTLTFAGTQGETETFTVTPSVDAILETDETVGISMNNLVTALSGDLDITDLATLTIIDDDSSSVRINDVTETEGDNISFSLTLTDNVEGDVVVDVVFTNTTTETGDFTATTQQFTFTGGTAGMQTVTVPTNSDTFLEEDETFAVSLSLDSGNSEVVTTDTGVGTIIDNDAANVTINNVASLEGDNIGFTLILDNDVEGDVVVDISFANSTTESGDFTATSQQYTFTDGTAGSTTITVPTTEDAEIEPDEIFTTNLTLGTGNVNGEVDVTDTGTGTINNDDSAIITIENESGNEDAGAVTFTATLDYAVEGGLTVDVNTADGTATIVNSDYTAVTSQTLTFTGTQGETQTFTVLPSVDAILETDETVGVSMNNLVATLSGDLDITDLATLTINNDDASAVTIADNSGAENGGAIIVTATLDNAVQGGFTVDVTSVDGTATIADSDYTAIAGQTLTFAGTAGETQTFTLTPTVDSKLEANETVTFTQSKLDNTTVGVNISDGATVSITNDDAATVTIADNSGAENGGAIIVTATLDNAVQGGFTVDVTSVDGTATIADSDYTAIADQTLTFAGTAGETQTFTLTPTADSKLEANETVTFTQGNLDNTTVGVNISDGATVTINNDDASAVTIADNSGAENGGAITVTATLDNAVQGGFTVDVTSVDGTATIADSDYTAIAGQTLTFAGTAGETQTFTLTPTSDSKLEANETVTFTQGNLQATTHAVSISDGATVTINNDDASAVTIADNSGAENGGAITVTATLDNAVQGGFTVDVTSVDGTATIGDSDYTAIAGQTLTFAGTAGETQTFTLTPTVDSKLEANETVTFTQGNLQATTLAVSISDGATVSITNDDAAAVTIADNSGAENGGAITVTATLDNAVQGGFTVDVTGVDGTATIADSDYAAIAGQTLTFVGTAGETQTFTLTPTSDSKLEANETVTFTQGNLQATTHAVSISDGATVTINNDDASEVSIVATTQASEPEIDGLFTLTLSNPIDVETEITFAVSGEAIEGTDYSNVGTRIIILANTIEVTIPVEVIDDALVESGGEDVIVTLLSTNTAVSLGATNAAAVTISDDDTTEVTIVATDDSAQEETPATNNAEFTVSLSNASAVNTIISYSVGGTATEGSDFTNLTGTITILAGSKTATIDVVVTDDVLFEDSETVIIVLTVITSGDVITTIGTSNEATVTIIDNDIDCYAGDNIEICSSDANVTLSTATENNASDFAWTTNGTGNFTDASILNAVYNPSDDDRTNGELQLTLNITGVSGTDSDVMTLKIWPAVILNTGVETATINEGETYTVSGAIAENYAGILWTSTGGSFDDPTAMNSVFTPSTTNNVVLRMTATGLGVGACSDDFDEIAISINDFPTASDESVVGLEDQDLLFTETDFSANYFGCRG